jgi:hypothetical protein
LQDGNKRERAGIERGEMGIGGEAEALEGLEAIVIEFKGAAEREGVLFHLAGFVIEDQDIISGRAVRLEEAVRAVQEGANEDLPVLIPASDSILLDNFEGRIEGDKGALGVLGIVEHHTKGSRAEVAYIEDLICPPLRIGFLAGEAEIVGKDKNAGIAAAGIVEKKLGTSGTHKISGIDDPIATEIVKGLGVIDVQV